MPIITQDKNTWLYFREILHYKHLPTKQSKYSWHTDRAMTWQSIIHREQRNPNLPTFTYSESELDMARSRNNNFELIEYRLDDKELSAYDAWIAKEQVDLDTLLNEIAGRDCKISFTFVENNSSWCVSITGKESNKYNQGKTLTTWSDEPLDALAMGYYKMAYIFKNGAWAGKDRSNRG